jgi:hypothetical protein
MIDVGRMTWRIRDSVTDVCDVWLESQENQRRFGDREIADLHAAHVKLGLLLSAIEATQVKEVA